ncbi:MAG: SsrA-binding protein SmpB, partial [Firmicutes bacterium]|nr:SsrA-binding protein SmpB [Bacillota bacterium]
MAEGKLISNNKKAYHDYFFEDTYEAGIVLTGCEIKSVRAGGVNLRDSFAKVEKGEIWVYNMHISPYEQGNRYNPDPMRPKKLLLNRQEIRRMEQAVTQKGL